MMLNIVLTIYSVIKFLVISSITISSLIGKWLVFFLYHLQNIVVKVLVNIFQAVIIAFEDFNIFIHYIWNNISTILYNLYTYIYITANSILETFINLKLVLCVTFAYINKLFSSIYNTAVAVYAIIIQLCYYIKHYVLLFGSGVWFLVTLVPIGLVYLGTLSSYYLGILFEEIFVAADNGKNAISDVVLNVYNFITDVPVESLLGIIAIVCLYYVLAPITKECILFVYRNLLYIQRRIVEKCVYCKTMFKQKFKSKIKSPAPLRETTNKTNDNVCVACQDRERCVLLLPCKHVCLCKDCYRRLPVQYYGKACPICRQRIAKSMDIFL